MDRNPHAMQQPASPADPRSTVVPLVGNTLLFPSIPGYRVLKKLGQGGMATVYLATQQSLDRPVSIKVMEREALQDETSKQRFENEARTIAKLSHPGIVGIHEVGRTSDGRMYYIMPYVANGDLAQRDLRGDEPRIVDVLRTLLSALEYAHARGFVHRDVKRENVLFDADNRPLLTDFGIALSKSDTVRITTAGLAVGSSAYMAPEQARGDVVDARADLYSVGVLAYELLTGELPFQSNDALAMALMHAQDPVPRLPAAKAHWQGFIDRAMAKSPDRRYANSGQMLAALDRIGRRSGSHLSGLMLRTFDRTVAGKPWQSPRLLLLVGLLLLATALYAERDRLPHFGGTRTLAKPVVTVRHPIAAAPAPKIPETAPAPAASLPVVEPPTVPADTKQPTHTATHARRRSTSTNSQPPPRPGFFHRVWNRIRHP